jgi:hypothetical protein
MSITACAQTISNLQDTRQQVGLPPKPAATMPANSMEAQTMPTDRLDKPILLDDELESIRAAVADFNSVVVRDPGVPADYPTLPVMTLKNVTLGQFLQFVRAAYPGVEIVRIDGPAGALYSIRIRPDEEAIRRASFRADARADANRVRLYRLTDVVNALSADKLRVGPNEEAPNRDEVIKDATNQVLSLLQAALDQTDQDGPVTLKIHEPTQTLMFKGSRAKQDVLEEALSTLQPGGGRRPRAGGFYSGSSGSQNNPFGAGDYQQNAQQLFDQAAKMQAEAAQLEAQRAQMDADMKAMQKRADESTAKKPSKD